MILGRQFKRACIVTVDTLQVSGLRVSFKVTKSTGKEPNTLDLSITNLSEHSRANVKKKGVKVVLEAGYEESGVGILFSGFSRTVDHVRDGPNWVTKIQCGDGETAFRYTRVSESFRPGVKLHQIVSYLVQQMGLNPGNAIDQAKKSGIAYAHGYSTSGRASLELARVLSAANMTYSIQDGELQVLRPGEAHHQVVILNKDSGLIGSPEHGSPPMKTKKASTIKAKCLLQHRLRAGGQLQLDSESHKGLFKVLKLQHQGDTSAGDWYSETESIPFGEEAPATNDAEDADIS